MVKRRLIFTLLYSAGFFMLSRNFRLQKVGNLAWINQHYNFQEISFAIDELIILDVTREGRDLNRFCEHLRELSGQCLIPIAAGGGITSERQAEALLKSGADKIVVNTAIFHDPELVKKLVSRYGSQCLIGSVDFKIIEDCPQVLVKNGGEVIPLKLEEYLAQIKSLGVGEIYLNSIDKDGTGQGYLLDSIDYLRGIEVPLILAGGAGNFQHLLAGIQKSAVDAVATANLFNFIGNGLPQARIKLLEAGVELASWDLAKIKVLRNYFAGQGG